VRVVFLGNASWSVPSLEAVAGSPHELVLVITRSPRPAGRGNRLTPTAVAESARRLGLPLQEVETVKSGEGFDALARAAPDVLAVVAYGEIVPKTVLDVPAVAPVNVHFSLLPALRGAAPVQRAILEGLSTTGVTTIRMDEGMDTGPILLQGEEKIWPQDDAGSLSARLARLGGRLLVETMDRMEAGSLLERPQDEAKATYAPKLGPEDRVIDWSLNEALVLRRILAMSPDPGAETRFRGRLLKVYKADAADSQVASMQQGEPGEIFLATEQALAVETGYWPVVLEEVQPEGKRRMSAAEFVRGHRPEVGERLG
jgi:methionyl-tRNA formyltransferase